jgi:hypothetical protein
MQNYSPNTTLCANQLHQADDDYIQAKHVAGLDTHKVVFEL